MNRTPRPAWMSWISRLRSKVDLPTPVLPSISTCCQRSATESPKGSQWSHTCRSPITTSISQSRLPLHSGACWRDARRTRPVGQDRLGFCRHGMPQAGGLGVSRRFKQFCYQSGGKEKEADPGYGIERFFFFYFAPLPYLAGGVNPPNE